MPSKTDSSSCSGIAEENAILAIHLAFPFSPAKGHQLIRYFGDAKKTLLATPSQVEEVMQDGGKSSNALSKILAENIVQTTCQQAEEMGIEIIPFTSSLYPQQLFVLPDPPLILYTKGDFRLKASGIAIVGTRQASIYGKAMAREFAASSSSQGITVISGLARGIDTAAHEGALECGQTIAVVGSGLAHIYPKENTALAHKICSQGSLYSEYPLFTPPDRFQFPRRNRIIAALADAALLMEAPLRSGAMSTLNWALRLGKLCFALPGRVDCETFSGNHLMIKEGKAKLVENAAEMISILRPGAFRETKKRNPFGCLTVAENQLLLQLPQNEISFDELVIATGLPIATLNALLMSLTLKNILREYPGKLFRKVLSHG